jgi:hypothetical protein
MRLADSSGLEVPLVLAIPPLQLGFRHAVCLLGIGNFPFLYRPEARLGSNLRARSTAPARIIRNKNERDKTGAKITEPGTAVA